MKKKEAVANCKFATASSRQKGEGRLFDAGNLKNCSCNSSCENDTSFSRFALFTRLAGENGGV